MKLDRESARQGLGALMLVALGAGCQPAQKLPPFDASRPIETEKGYRQGGQLVDGKDLWQKLKDDPDTRPHVRRAEALEVTSLVLAASGGALIGWPLGEAAGGAADPMWELAAVGGGLLVLSIPLTVWGISSRNKAITVHNAGVGQAYYQLPNSPFLVGSRGVGVSF